jgi:putative ABC transport system permease protein
MEAAQSGHVVSLVNQSFIDQYNWRENPVGKTLILRPGTENELHRTISAVFRDFHFFSLKEKIGPHIISMRKEPTNININVLVKTNPANLKRAYEIIETEWYAFAPDRPVEYVLMDDEIRSFYQQERRVGNITLLFSVLALLLSFGGLIIFVTYITKLRSKEIALRQVLGASMMQIILVLNKKTFWIIMLAALFGSTFSYLLINQWLTNFANTITLHPIAFIAATIAGYGIAFMIIVGQSYKSAISNPLATLGQE